MTEFTIQEWTIDGDEAHAQLRGTAPDGTTFAATVSRSHDAPGWTIEGREGEVYDSPNHAIQHLEEESLEAHEALDDLTNSDDDALTVAAKNAGQQPAALFNSPAAEAHLFPYRHDARSTNRLVKRYFPHQDTDIVKRRDGEWVIQLTPIMPATELTTVKYLSSRDLEELQARDKASLCGTSPAARALKGTRIQEHPPKPYGEQAPFLTLTLKNETTGDIWTHAIGQQDASALSEWWAEQSEYQRQDLPYEVEETVSRIVAAYAEHDNEDDPRMLRPATEKEIHAYLMKQSGVVNVYSDGAVVRCSRLSDSGHGLLTWEHSRLDQWTVTIEGGHTWLRGPNNLGWIITNEAVSTK